MYQHFDVPDVHKQRNSLTMSNTSEGTDQETESMKTDDVDSDGKTNPNGKTKEYSPAGLKRFVESLQPEMLNLMNEFADAEMFLIDGDSLFMELLMNKNLDWYYSGQFLHLVYLCERYLHLFVRKGAVFELVFFQDYQELWKSDPSLHLARQLLKIHFSENIENKVLCDFKNPWDPEFRKYIQEFCPSFILLSDGNFESQLSSRPFSLPNSLLSKVFLHQLRICLMLGMNCGFTEGIEFRTSTLNGYHVVSHSRAQRIQPNEIIFRKLCSYNNNFKTDVDNSDILSEIIKVSDILNFKNNERDCRLLVHSASACVYLNQVSDNSEDIHFDLIRVVLLHAVLLTELPLTHRALSMDDIKDTVDPSYLPKSLVAKLQYFLTELLECVLQFPDGLNWSKVNISDIWDGRLLYTLLHLLMKNKRNGKDISLSSSTQNKFSLLVNSVSSVSKIKINPFPILVFLGDGNNLNSEPESTSKYSQDLPHSRSGVPQEFPIEGLIKVNCPLLNDYADEILNTPSLRRRGLDEPDVAKLVVSGNDFDEIHHWHSGKPLSDDYERTKENKNEEENKKKRMRMQGKYATFMQRYSESLEGETSCKAIVVEKDNKRGKKNEKQSKKARMIIENNQKKKDEEKLIKEEQLWSEKRKELDSLVFHQEYDRALAEIEKFGKNHLVEKVNVKRLMMKAFICWKKCQLDVAKSKHGGNDVQSCFLAIRELVENHGESLKDKEKVTLGKYLNDFGFDDVAVKTGLTKEDKPGGHGLNSSRSLIKKSKDKGDNGFDISSSQLKESKGKGDNGLDTSPLHFKESADKARDDLTIPTSPLKESTDEKGDDSIIPTPQLKQSTDEQDDDCSIPTPQLKELTDEKDDDLTTTTVGLKESTGAPCLEESTDEKDGDYTISSSRFQLQNMGHLLRREIRTDADPRVDNFIPETWQRKLLDAVDNKQSALIVAPTSSGKTYASYYCMERILKEDNEGVVVYVSPTKALVNQVAATCYARYHKKVMPPGRSVFGVFTRDYRTNALNSQILVTVPQCLEILLLSPARQDWVAKIKYVVFDEVHCIGSEIGAEYWEHLLLLIRCPFLALSATIRNPEDLHKWLQTAERGKQERDEKNKSVRRNSPKSYEVALVIYNERYNDLEKFNYVKPSNDVPDGLQHVHPCSILTYRQLAKSDKFPSHISLSPREALALYDAMKKTWPEKVQNFCPGNYFKGKGFISKQDARVYEVDLEKEFMTWDRQRLEMVIKCLEGKTASRGPQRDYVKDNFYSLLEVLDKSGKLPAIFFSFDRSLCADLAAETVDYLEEKEEKIRAKKSLHMQAKLDEKQSRRQAKVEKRSRDGNCEDVEMRKASSSGHNDFHGSRRNNTSEQSCFLFDNPQEKGCSYAGVGVIDAEDGEMIVRQLGRSRNNDSYFEKGLCRGVSYHHSGMSAKQRRVVEMLFRKKFLRVVFATGTLALGINMPCKTVVFAGDSVFLNTLQFHQISGRAGRRGFDLLGNVIFLGIPQAKIQRLMTVNLPRIVGNFPLNVTLVLRLLLMVNKSDNQEVALNQALTLLQNPLICKDQLEFDLQLKHHFLFSVEMLVRQGLLDVKGNPQGLAGLATHLHYHEPANLVFVSLLQQGLFHDICKSGRSNGDKFSKDFLNTLVVILSHLFTSRRLHSYTLTKERSTSKLVLEKLPPAFERGLKKYNKSVHEVFDHYLRTVAVHIYDTMGEDVTLPLSNTKFISSQSYCPDVVSTAHTLEECVSTGATLEAELGAISLPYKACSSFAALSGHTDTRLWSSHDLISNIRYQVYTDVKVVPILHNDVTLNSYAVDFFNHGNYGAIVLENDIKQGDAFHLLKDFMLVVKSICVSLAEMGPEDGDDVIAAFTQLSEEYSASFASATFNIR